MSQTWSIYVELAARTAADDLIVRMRRQLETLHPSVGHAPNGHLYARVFIVNTTLRQATDAAIKYVTAAAKEVGVAYNVVGLEVLTLEEVDRRTKEPPVPELVGVSEIADILKVASRQRAKQITELDGFPPPVTHLKSGPVYLAEQVRAFKERWHRAGGHPFKEVRLSGAETEVLLMLRDTADDRRNVRTLAHAASLRVDRSTEDSELLEARFPSENEETPAVLHSLARKKLLRIHDEVERGDKEVVTLQLTNRGVRAPLKDN
jgi:hypothetical protein